MSIITQIGTETILPDIYRLSPMVQWVVHQTLPSRSISLKQFQGTVCDLRVQHPQQPQTIYRFGCYEGELVVWTYAGDPVTKTKTTLQYDDLMTCLTPYLQS